MTLTWQYGPSQNTCGYRLIRLLCRRTSRSKWGRNLDLAITSHLDIPLTLYRAVENHIQPLIEHLRLKIIEQTHTYTHLPTPHTPCTAALNHSRRSSPRCPAASTTSTQINSSTTAAATSLRTISTLERERLLPLHISPVTCTVKHHPLPAAHRSKSMTCHFGAENFDPHHSHRDRQLSQTPSFSPIPHATPSTTPFSYRQPGAPQLYGNGESFSGSQTMSKSADYFVPSTNSATTTCYYECGGYGDHTFGCRHSLGTQQIGQSMSPSTDFAFPLGDSPMTGPDDPTGRVLLWPDGSLLWCTACKSTEVEHQRGCKFEAYRSEMDVHQSASQPSAQNSTNVQDMNIGGFPSTELSDGQQDAAGTDGPMTAAANMRALTATAPPAVVRKKLVWTKAHADCTTAHASIHGPVVVMRKVNIPSDDWESIKDDTVHGLCAEILDAIQAEPNGPEAGWTERVKRYGTARYVETMRQVNSILEDAGKRKTIEADIQNLLKEVRNVHESGMPEPLFAKNCRSGYRPELGMTCMQRGRKVTTVARMDLYIMKNILEGHGFQDLARSPHQSLDRKLTNVVINGSKPTASINKAGKAYTKQVHGPSNSAPPKAKRQTESAGGG